MDIVYDSLDQLNIETNIIFRTQFGDIKFNSVLLPNTKFYKDIINEFFREYHQGHILYKIPETWNQHYFVDILNYYCFNAGYDYQNLVLSWSSFIHIFQIAHETDDHILLEFLYNYIKITKTEVSGYSIYNSMFIVSLFTNSLFKHKNKKDYYIQGICDNCKGLDICHYCEQKRTKLSEYKFTNNNINNNINNLKKFNKLFDTYNYPIDEYVKIMVYSFNNFTYPDKFKLHDLLSIIHDDKAKKSNKVDDQVIVLIKQKQRI